MLTVKATETSPKELLPQASLPVLHDSFRLRTASFLAAFWNQQLLHLKLSIASLYGLLFLSATHDFYSLSVRSDQRICIGMRTPSTSSSSGPFRRAAGVQLQRCQFPPRQFFAHSRSACRANAAELPDATSRTSSALSALPQLLTRGSSRTAPTPRKRQSHGRFRCKYSPR